MPFIDTNSKEIHSKILYYGAKNCGKTTCIKWIKDHSKKDIISYSHFDIKKSNMDLMTLFIGNILGFKSFFHIYSISNTSKEENLALLNGIDGIVFIADSKSSAQESNLSSFSELKYFLDSYWNSKIPIALQYHKRDLKKQISLEELRANLNHNNKDFVSSAKDNYGIMEPLKHVLKSVISVIKSKDFQ